MVRYDVPVEVTVTIIRDDEEIEIIVTGYVYPPEPDVGVFSKSAEIISVKTADGQKDVDLTPREILECEEKLIDNS